MLRCTCYQAQCYCTHQLCRVCCAFVDIITVLGSEYWRQWIAHFLPDGGWPDGPQSPLLVIFKCEKGVLFAEGAIGNVVSPVQDHPASNVWTVGAPYILLYYIVSRFMWPQLGSTMYFSLAPWDVWPFLWWVSSDSACVW